MLKKNSTRDQNVTLVTFCRGLLQLTGPEAKAQTVPEICTCGCKEFYQQADFKRSVGVGLMIVASVLTCVFLVMGLNWWLQWSPFYVLLALDMILRKRTPLAVICYRCATIYRGIPKAEAAKVQAFDLETFDRIQYKKLHEQSPQT